jgi:hypothetical protein
MLEGMKRKDTNQTAFSIVDQATGEVEKAKPPHKKNDVAVERGKKGGVVGGLKRAISLTPERRKEISLKAINSRWKKEAASEV